MVKDKAKADQRSASGAAAGATADEDAVPVTYGPACLVVAVIFGLLLSVSMTIGAWLLIGHQPAQAIAAIDQQLIPWVEQSVLKEPDKTSILERLRELSSAISRGEIKDKQLSRLRMVVSDSPLFQWGTIQQIEDRIAASGLSDEEKANSELIIDRLLHSAVLQKLEMQRMGWILESLTSLEPRSGRLNLLDNTTDADLREFLTRANNFCNKEKVPNERFDRSVSQAFRILTEQAIQPSPAS